jgi:hypothetical protein
MDTFAFASKSAALSPVKVHREIHLSFLPHDRAGAFPVLGANTLDSIDTIKMLDKLPSFSERVRTQWTV